MCGAQCCDAVQSRHAPARQAPQPVRVAARRPDDAVTPVVTRAAPAHAPRDRSVSPHAFSPQPIPSRPPYVPPRPRSPSPPCRTVECCEQCGQGLRNANGFWDGVGLAFPGANPSAPVWVHAGCEGAFRARKGNEPLRRYGGGDGAAPTSRGRDAADHSGRRSITPPRGQSPHAKAAHRAAAPADTTPPTAGGYNYDDESPRRVRLFGRYHGTDPLSAAAGRPDLLG